MRNYGIYQGMTCQNGVSPVIEYLRFFFSGANPNRKEHLCTFFADAGADANV